MPVKISVIIPCYNQEKYIAECLDSVLCQTFQDWEIVVVNDGSKDNSLKILEEYAKKYLKIHLINQNNQGVIAARNNAIKQAEGEYIYPLDGDDAIAPECLEKLYHAMQLTNADVVYSQVQNLATSEIIRKYKKPTIWTMSRKNQVVDSGLYRKSDWIKYGGYDYHMYLGLEDWDFWLNFIMDKKKFYCVPEPLFLYRRLPVSRNSGLSKSNAKILRKYVYQKYKGLKFYAVLYGIGQFFFQRQVTKDGSIKIKICKIPLWHYSVNQE